MHTISVISTYNYFYIIHQSSYDRLKFKIDTKIDLQHRVNYRQQMTNKGPFILFSILIFIVKKYIQIYDVIYLKAVGN